MRIHMQVEVNLDKLGSEAGAAYAVIDINSILSALINGHEEDYTGIKRLLPGSVMRACGDGVCSPGENAPFADVGTSYGNDTNNANATSGNGTAWKGMDSGYSSWGSYSGGMNNTNSTSGTNSGYYNGTSERDTMQPHACKADCMRAVCPISSPPGHMDTMPMVRKRPLN